MARSSPSWSGSERDLARVIGSLAASKDTGDEGAETGKVADAEATAAHDGVHVLTEERAAMCSSISGSTPRPPRAALGFPLRGAIVRAGGFRISEGFISPLSLVAIGLLSGLRCGRVRGRVG